MIYNHKNINALIETTNKMENSTTTDSLPKEFCGCVVDFTRDLTTTFPEYSHLWEKWQSAPTEEEWKQLYAYMKTVYPERFFDILYQNDNMFADSSTANTHFLPNVDFKMLFRCEGVSEHTHTVMWKYLQLLLFAVVQSVADKSCFGETMDLFDGIDESELQSKLEETMNGISQFFTNETNGNGDSPDGDSLNGDSLNGDSLNGDSRNGDSRNGDSRNRENVDMGSESFYTPNHAEMHEHLKGLFDGKIGKLATEMAEEISKDINGIFGEEDQSNIQTTQDVVKKLMKNPKKMLDLVKLVGNKLKNKMDSGEISQEEIMKEAGDIFGKMKGSMGNKDLTEMFKNMASQMGMKNSKVNTSAMESNFKKEAMKDKMRKKMEMKKAQASAQAQAHAQSQAYSDVHLQQVNANQFVFSTDDNEAQPRSVRPSHKQQKEDIERLMDTHGITNDIVAKPNPTKKKSKK